ncbi:DNA-directed RNA polymerase I subunit RPA12 [Nematocida sp. AWRm77]|nr:DNA-directed RNA polymerase I subunit RPA12 [Nematocida sp. AWRm77]
MFCSSCEKYLNALDTKCGFCSTKCPPRALRTKTQHKEYSVRVQREETKGIRIKEECPECKSEYLYYYTMQLRSADEGQTVFYQCDCGYKAKLNT